MEQVNYYDLLTTKEKQELDRLMLELDEIINECNEQVIPFNE